MLSPLSPEKEKDFQVSKYKDNLCWSRRKQMGLTQSNKQLPPTS